MSGIVWKLQWEADLAPVVHGSLHELLTDVYPDHAQSFRGGRSWSGARPEGRVVGYADNRPIAHLGFIRRTLRLEGSDDTLFVGDVGLVGVAPDLRQRGVGLELLAETTMVFRLLRLPWGLLTCREEVMPFYERGGWHRMPGQATRKIDNDGEPELDVGSAMVLPLGGSLDGWPHQATVVRDGLEV